MTAGWVLTYCGATHYNFDPILVVEYAVEFRWLCIHKWAWGSYLRSILQSFPFPSPLRNHLVCSVLSVCLLSCSVHWNMAWCLTPGLGPCKTHTYPAQISLIGNQLCLPNLPKHISSLEKTLFSCGANLDSLTTSLSRIRTRSPLW